MLNTIVLSPFDKWDSVVVFLVECFVEENYAGNIVERLFSGGEKQLPELTPIFLVVLDSGLGKAFPDGS